jgi:hypothetical protein
MSLSASIWINDSPSTDGIRRTQKQPFVRAPEPDSPAKFSNYESTSSANISTPNIEPRDNTERVSAMLAKLASTSGPVDESGLADFREVPIAKILSTDLASSKSGTELAQITGASANTNSSNFSNYAHSYSDVLYKSPESSRAPDPQAWMMDKISYLIHLAEQQHRAPTKYIVEEFVLYLLLGVFVIFVVDGFARSGVYRR